MSSPHLIAAVDPTATVEIRVAVLLLCLFALALLAVVGGGLILAVRRIRRREIRELSSAAEELRGGRLHRRIDLEPRSPLAPVGESLSRLAHDLALRWADAEGAGRLLSLLTDTLRDRAVVVTDADGDIRSVSRGGAALFGWEADSLRRRPAAALFDENSWKELLPKLARRDLREVGIESDAIVRGREGSPVPAHVSFRALRRAESEVAGMLLVIRDAAEESRLAAELTESERRYERLVQGLDEGVALVRDGRLLYANPALTSLLEWDPRSQEDLRLLDRVDSPDLLMVRDALAAAEAGNARRPIRLLARLVGPSGDISAAVRLSVSSVEHGGRPAALVSMFDETSLRWAAAELRRNEAELDAVLESSSEGFAVLADGSNGGLVRMANARFGTLVGLRTDDLLGAGEGELLRIFSGLGPEGSRLAAFVAGAARSARRESFEFGGPEGKVLDVAVLPLVDSQGSVTGRLIALRDVTDELAERRRLESDADSLRQNQAELEASCRELERVVADVKRRSEDLDRLNAELKTLDRMKSELLAKVSHELQQPLVAIRGFTEMILKERLGSITDEQRKGLTLSLRNVDRLVSLIDELLTGIQEEQREGRLHPTDFPLAPLLDEAVELLAERIRERRIDVRKTVEPRDLRARADRDKILQVFVNLLSNAVKYNRDGGTVEVSAHRGKPGYLEIEVLDTGMGISEEDLERVFRPFERGAAAEEAAKGTGVGLSIVRDILRRHGCSIDVSSRKGEGTRFTFSLPTDEPEVGPEESEPVPERPAPPRNPETSTRSVGRRGIRIIRRPQSEL